MHTNAFHPANQGGISHFSANRWSGVHAAHPGVLGGNHLAHAFSRNGLHNGLAHDGLHNGLAHDGLRNGLAHDGLHNGLAHNGLAHEALRNGLAHEGLHNNLAHQQLAHAGRADFARHDFDQHMRDRDRFGRHEFHRGFVGWAGPVFWPYAYNNLFGYTFWPYDYYGSYYDPFWDYGYNDLFAGIFSPYDAGYGYGYGNGYGHRWTRRHHHLHVAYGRPSGEGPATTPADAALLCEQEAAGVVQFPVDDIAKAVQPTGNQQPKLDDLRSATAKANDTLRGSCPTQAALTPVGRLNVVEKRLGAMLDAVNVVKGPLQAFYDALNDEQRARFDQLGRPAKGDQAQTLGGGGADQICSQQSGGVTQFPIDDIAKAVTPDVSQRAALEELRQASASAAEKVKGSCPAATPLTATGRLDAVQKRLQAMLDAVKTVRPSLEKFYASLSDEQKARFNVMARREQG